MINAKLGFSKVTKAAALSISMLAGCAENPHQQGEARGAQAAVATYGIAKAAGLNDNNAAVAGVLVGLGAGAIAERNEPDCYGNEGLQQRTTTVNGRSTVRTTTALDVTCKPVVVSREIIRSSGGYVQPRGPLADNLNSGYRSNRTYPVQRGFRY